MKKNISLLALALVLPMLANARMIDESGNIIPKCPKGIEVLKDFVVERESSRSALLEAARIVAIDANGQVWEFSELIQVVACKK